MKYIWKVVLLIPFLIFLILGGLWVLFEGDGNIPRVLDVPFSWINEKVGL